MNILKIGFASVLSTIGTSNIIESKMKNYDNEILQPIDTVSIIIPSFNEEQFIETTLTSLKNQSIIEKYPGYFELILVDSGSTDNTINIAKNYVDKIITAPRGKLTARNLATNHSNGNIIVSVDADTYYPYHWLNSLLTPFNDYTNPKYNNIIGVYGSTFDYSINNILGKLFSIADFIYSSILNRTRMTGRNSAYYKHIFYSSGKFNEDINQFNIWEIFNEEEKMFGIRLKNYGNLLYKINASCYHLGGMKSIGRFGIGNGDTLKTYNFGSDRF